MAAAIAVAISSSAAAAASALSAKTYAYPGYSANWTRGAGLADPTGGGAYGLVLAKTDPSKSDVNGSGVSISGFTSPLAQLGFDLKDGSACGSYVMFRITTDSGLYVDVSCNRGVMTSLGNGWSRVRIDPTSGGYAGVSAKYLKLRIVAPTNETAAATVDNIDVNGSLIPR